MLPKVPPQSYARLVLGAVFKNKHRIIRSVNWLFGKQLGDGNKCFLTPLFPHFPLSVEAAVQICVHKWRNLHQACCKDRAERASLKADLLLSDTRIHAPVHNPECQDPSSPQPAAGSWGHWGRPSTRHLSGDEDRPRPVSGRFLFAVVRTEEVMLPLRHSDEVVKHLGG